MAEREETDAEDGAEGAPGDADWEASPACPTCDAYVHPLIPTCVSCGTDIGYRGLTDHDEEATYLENNPPSKVAAEAAEIAGILAHTLGKIGWRYLGGLPGRPSESNATLSAVGAELVLADRSGEVARVQADHLLAVVPFVEDVPLLKGAIGIGFGNVFAFASPSFEGGGLTISYAADEKTLTFAVGNRSGLTLSAKGKPEFFRGVAPLIGMWAWPIALDQQAVVGVEAYAQELGLAPPNPSAAKAQPSDTSAPGPAATTALEQLQGLHDAGLLTDDEYAQKRKLLDTANDFTDAYAVAGSMHPEHAWGYHIDLPELDDRDVRRLVERISAALPLAAAARTPEERHAVVDSVWPGEMECAAHMNGTPTPDCAVAGNRADGIASARDLLAQLEPAQPSLFLTYWRLWWTNAIQAGRPVSPAALADADLTEGDALRDLDLLARYAYAYYYDEKALAGTSWSPGYSAFADCGPCQQWRAGRSLKKA